MCPTRAQRTRTGAPREVTFGVRSFCSRYGAVKTLIDVKDADNLVTPDRGNGRRGTRRRHDVRSISCWLNTSDLCYKNRVEKNAAGKIRPISFSGSTVSGTWVDVRTHEARYALRRDISGDIYCENDPEGGAFTAP